MIAWILALSLALADAPAEVPPPLTFEPPPEVGAESVITVTDDLGRIQPGATVQVLHRPELDGERQIAIGITDSRGRVRWTPELAGVARVRAGDIAEPVVVGRPGPPPTAVTLLALLLAGAAGGTVYGFAAWRRRGSA